MSVFDGLPLFGYDLIMADPPWKFENWSEAGEHKNASAKYDCMELADIKALPVGHLADKDCILWLWATHPLHREAFDVCDAWGFKYVTGGVWVKRTVKGNLHFGTGYRLRSASEPFLIATNGNPATAKNVRTVVEGVAREHSRKPKEAYVIAEKYMPHARRLDLFSRQSRPGWDNWGNEKNKFDGAAA